MHNLGRIYTLHRGEERKEVGSNLTAAVEAFAREILTDGLPYTGAPMLVLREEWITDGRWGVAGIRLARIVYAASSHGVWHPDGSGAPATVAHGPAVDEWIRGILAADTSR